MYCRPVLKNLILKYASYMEGAHVFCLFFPKKEGRQRHIWRVKEVFFNIFTTISNAQGYQKIVFTKPLPFFMVKADDLTFQYPSTNPITFPDFSVEAGKSLLVLGESGCGKTTLLHLLAGLLRPASGKVDIDGTRLNELSSSRTDQFRGQYIGLIFQKPYFIESLSILDNLLISPFAGTEEKAIDVADRLYIGDLLHRLPSQLSVGQQQRVTIARAVMNQPRLLLADEPTSALDNKNCSKVIDLLQEESLANDAALIIVTHDDRLKREVSDIIELPSLSN